MQRYRQSLRAVVFFGPDGAGKTTQANLVSEHLRSKDIRVWRTWIRGRHTLAYVLSNFFIRYGYYDIVRTGSKVHKVFNPHLMPKIKPIWIFIEFISVLPLIITRMYLPIALGYTVVAERYVIDTLVHIYYWVSVGLLNSHLTRIMLGFIPSNSILIYLNAETSTLLQRIQDDHVTVDFIGFQQCVYNLFAKMLTANVIDTSKYDVNGAFNVIKEIIDNVH